MDVTPSDPALDLDNVDAGDWPERPFPLADCKAVRVVMRQSVLNDIHQHGLSSPAAEICGVLVGQGYQDATRPYIYIENIIQGAHSDSQTAQVTFTGKTWEHIHTEFDRDYADKRILGWYHTHPGFGIFLSGMDLFIQENYFSASDQMAFVYDPHSGEEGLFVWRKGAAVRDGFLIDPDVPEDPPASCTVRDEPPLTAGAGAPAPNMVEDRIRRLESRLRLAFVALAAVLLIAIAAPLAVAVLSRMQIQEAIQQQQPMPPQAPEEPTLSTPPLPEAPVPDAPLPEPPLPDSPLPDSPLPEPEPNTDEPPSVDRPD